MFKIQKYIKKKVKEGRASHMSTTTEEAPVSSWDPFTHPYVSLSVCLQTYVVFGVFCVFFFFLHNWDPTTGNLSGISCFFHLYLGAVLLLLIILVE